jgi:hypothetical protein
MKSSFEHTLIEVWRQSLVENATAVELDGRRYPVRRTPKRGLRQVDFVFEGNEIRGLEQNPDTRSGSAKLARSGKKVMQFLSGGAVRGGCGGWKSEAVWDMRNANGAEQSSYGEMRGPALHHRRHRECLRYLAKTVFATC